MPFAYISAEGDAPGQARITIMDRIYRVLTAILCAVIAVTIFPAAAGAVPVSGISISDSSPAPGSTFTVTVSVPAAENADTASVRVEFDSSAFEVTEWSPKMENSLCNSGKGFFVLTSANADRVIDLSRGLELKATVRASDSASGAYTFRLVKHSFSYVKDNGYEYVELWQPTFTEASVNIGGSPANGTSGGSGSVPVSIPRNTDYPVPAATTAPAVQPVTSEEQVYIDEDLEEPYKYVQPDGDTPAYAAADQPYETTEPAAAMKVNAISLVAELEGMPVTNVKATTKRDFFAGDTEIRMIGSAQAKEAAEQAARTLGLESRDRYAFDISVIDTATGQAVTSLPEGYIDFSLPVPDLFGGSLAGLTVYHIDNGFPRVIASSVTVEDGLMTISFRTNSFSPYMIIDVNEREFRPDIVSAGNVNSAAAGRPLNPDTGAAAAVILPSALVGCAILARKQTKKRKRKKEPIE